MDHLVPHVLIVILLLFLLILLVKHMLIGVHVQELVRDLKHQICQMDQAYPMEDLFGIVREMIEEEKNVKDIKLGGENNSNNEIEKEMVKHQEHQ